MLAVFFQVYSLLENLFSFFAFSSCILALAGCRSCLGRMGEGLGWGKQGPWAVAINMLLRCLKPAASEGNMTKSMEIYTRRRKPVHAIRWFACHGEQTVRPGRLRDKRFRHYFLLTRVVKKPTSTQAAPSILPLPPHPQPSPPPPHKTMTDAS